MIRKLVILGVFILFLIEVFTMPSVVEDYVNEKKVNAFLEINNKLEAIFEHQDKFFFLDHTNGPVRSVIISIPSIADVLSQYNKITRDLSSDGIRKEYDEDFNDLKSLYYLPYILSSSGELVASTKWNITTIGCGGEYIYMYSMLPYAIGYKRTADKYAPNISGAIKDALDYYLNNENSSYYKLIDEGSREDIISKIQELSNDYYYFEKRVDSTNINSIEKKFGGVLPKSSLGSNLTCKSDGYIHTSDYRVFVCTTPTIIYKIEEINPDQCEHEISQLETQWFFILFLLLVVIEVPLLYMEIKHKEKINETLYNKIKRLCNPSKFIKEYDKEKVDKANAIYQKLMKTSPDDKDTLYDLQSQAEEELGVSFVDLEMVEKLKKKVNPKRFMKPYNPEKVTLANELYSRLSKENISYKDIIEIEERSKKL